MLPGGFDVKCTVFALVTVQPARQLTKLVGLCFYRVGGPVTSPEM